MLQIGAFVIGVRAPRLHIYNRRPVLPIRDPVLGQMTLHTRSPHAYFPYIDGLRAIAVLSVVVYHLDAAWLPGGFAGVDVFFVISGFVVSASVGLRERTALPPFFLYFLARRIQRILPALFVCLLVTSLASALFIPEAWLSEGNQRTGRFAFFGLSNLVLSQNTNSYFSPIADFNPYTHTWSLGVEEQFYILFPLIFWPWILGRRRLALGLFVVAGAVSFGYAWSIRSTDGLAAFYLLASRFWELALGVVLYQAMANAGRGFDTNDADEKKGWKSVSAGVGLCSLILGLTSSQPASFPVPGAIWVVAGTSILLGSLHRQPATVLLVRLLTSTSARIVGKLSYSLYLWHWPVFVLFRWTVGLADWQQRVAALAIASILAWLSWKFIEQPVRISARLRRMPRIAIVLGGVAAIYASVSLHRAIEHRQPRWSLSTVARNAHDWYPTTPRVKNPSPCGLLQPTIEAVGSGKRITYARNVCARPVRGPNVFAAGDSHAMAFGTVFAAYVEDTGAQVTLYNNAGCAYLGLRAMQEQSPACRASFALVTEDIISHLQPGDVVFLPSLRMPRFVDQWVRFPRAEVVNQALGAESAAKRSGVLDEAAQVIRRFNEKGARVVIEAPNLVLNAPLYRCADPWTRTNPICIGGASVDRAEFERLRQPMFDALTVIVRGAKMASVFDPFPLLCPQGSACSGYRDGKPLFFDGDHVSGYGNRLLSPAFEAAMVGEGND